MFESLGEKFDSLLQKLRGQGKITERNIEDALREVRLALLEADVNVGVVATSSRRCARTRSARMCSQSLTPEQHFIKLVHRELVRLLGDKPSRSTSAARAPSILHGRRPERLGKTTTTAKLARLLRDERGRTPYLVPADVYRPAAIEQLRRWRATWKSPVHPSGRRRRPGGDRARRGRVGAFPRFRHRAGRHRRPTDRRRRAHEGARAHGGGRRTATT
jgi:signal recognition particle subunit SRP54